MYIKIAKDCYVPDDNIKLFVAYSGNAIRALVAKMKKEDKVIDMTGRKKTSTVVLLKTGEAVITPLGIDTINSRTSPGEK